MGRVELTNENHKSLKQAARRKNDMPIKQYLNDLLENIGIADAGIKVILTIPKSLTKNNEVELREWLSVRTELISKTYYPGE